MATPTDRLNGLLLRDVLPLLAAEADEIRAAVVEARSSADTAWKQVRAAQDRAARLLEAVDGLAAHVTGPEADKPDWSWAALGLCESLNEAAEALESIGPLSVALRDAGDAKRELQKAANVAHAATERQTFSDEEEADLARAADRINLTAEDGYIG